MSIQKLFVLLSITITMAIGAMEKEEPRKQQRVERRLASESKTELEKLDPELAEKLRWALISNRPEEMHKFMSDFMQKSDKELSELQHSGNTEGLERKKQHIEKIYNAIKPYLDRYYADKEIHHTFFDAIRTGDKEKIQKAFKQLGDNLYRKGGDILSEVMSAPETPNLEKIIPYLIQVGAPVTQHGLSMAIVTGRPDLVKILLENGAPINNQEIFSKMKQYAQQSHKWEPETAKVKFESMKALILSEIEKRKLHDIEAKRLLDKLNELQLLGPAELIQVQRK
jgi:hypothetical protein